MKKYINVGFMAIFTLMTFVLSFSSCSSEDDDIMSEYPPEEKPEVPHYDNLSYMPGANVQLINKAEYCKSIIADGKELIVTGNESGELIVPELKDPKVYIIFKEGITVFSDVFFGQNDFSLCSSCRSEEYGNGHQADGAEKDIAVHLKETVHGLSVEKGMPFDALS